MLEGSTPGLGRASLGSGDRDWGAVKGVVEEWGLGSSRSLVLSRPATASTCARLSKGRVSLGSRVSRHAGRARGARAALFFGRLSLSRGVRDFTSAHVSRLSRVFTDTALSTLQSPPLSA